MFTTKEANPLKNQKVTLPQDSAIQEDIKAFLQQVVSHPLLHAKWLNTLSFLEHIGSRKIIKSQNSHTLNYVILQHISEETRHALFFKALIHKVNPKSCPTFEPQYLLAGDEAEDYFQSIDRYAEKDLSLNKHNLQNYDKHLSLCLNNSLKGSDMRFARIAMAIRRYAGKAELALRDLFKQRNSHHLQKYNLQSRDKYAEKSRRYHSPFEGGYLYTTWMIEERAVMVYQIYNQILQQHSFSFNLNFVLQEEDHHLKTVVQVLQKQDPDFKNRTQRLFQYEKNQFTNLLKTWQSHVTQ